MTNSARARAERCFALARSTTFEGERDNAIAKGTSIAEAANLSLDLFDIPGRARRPIPRVNVVGGDTSYLSPQEVEAIFKAMVATMRDMPIYRRAPRYCPHGSDMALFGDSCVLCDRERGRS